MILNVGDKDPINKVLWNDVESVRTTAGGVLNFAEINQTAWLMKGAVLNINDSNREAHVVKTMEVIAGGTTTIPRVNKNHEFKAGDFVFRTAGGLAVTINSIDTTNVDYDAVTFSAALTGTVATDVLMQSIAAGASAGAFKYVPNCLLNDNTKLVGEPSVTGVISTYEVQIANLPYSVNSAIITALKNGANVNTFNF